MRTLIAFEEARQIVLDAARVVGPEAVRLGDAVGRTLAAPVTSRDDLPPFDTSAMDGWAVRLGDVRDLPAVLPVVATVHAGEVPAATLAPGTAIAVMTGAPLPSGTEAVAPVEWGTASEGRLRLDRAPEAGQFIRRRGEALREGEEVLPSGTAVTPGAIGLLASLGVHEVAVRRRPRVAVVATGDELVGVDEAPGPGQIRDANGPGLAAQVAAAGGAVVGPLVARDTSASVSAALAACTEADVLVFAGGVSMGERDLVRTELERRGVTWSFWKVAQRPGKPLAFGVLDGRPVLGLPGNPVSAAVCFEVYARPLLSACLGHADPLPHSEAGRLDAALPTAAGLHTFARVTARRDESGVLRLRPAGAQGSHVARSLLDSDGLAHLPASWDAAEAGAEVTFQRWAW